jgi:TFIIF-interacting CTD phosphatase-like protein
MADVYRGGIFSGIEITEAIRVQMEVQHHLQQQLEVSLVLS